MSVRQINPTEQIPTMGASGTNHSPGVVPDPGSVAGTGRFLREDSTWATPPAMGASGATHAAGLVPDPGSVAGSARFLREDAVWATPPNYTLGGSLAAANVSFGPGAGTGAALTSITGLDGNHTLTFTTGTTPTASAVVFTLTFTTSRGHMVYPVAALGGTTAYSTLAQMPSIAGGSATSYSMQSGATGLTASTTYVFNVSCP